MKDIVAPMYDQGYSALIEDLRAARHAGQHDGLQPGGIRPHAADQSGRRARSWPQCWTIYFAGGGVKGGRVVGKSDEIGGYPAERPVDARRKSSRRFTTASASIWRRNCPVRKAGRSRWSDSGTKAIKELF